MHQPQHSQPFTLVQAAQFDNGTILQEIERLQNSLEHLHATQTELREYVAKHSNDGDADGLKEVLEENTVVIASQEERIGMLRLALVKKGINISSGHYDLPVERPAPKAAGGGNESGSDGLFL